MRISARRKDLLLLLKRQSRSGLLRLLLRNLEGHEFVDQPFRRPDAVVAAVQELVRPKPEEKLRHHVAEITGASVNERQRNREAAIHVGFLRGDPAEVIEARQATMFNDEVEVLERRCDIVDVGDVEGVPVQGNDRWTFVNVDVLDTELLRRLKELVGLL